MSVYTKKNRHLEMLKIFIEETGIDEISGMVFGITAQQLTEKLSALDLTVERKTLYNDIALLQESGIDISKKKKGRTTFYYLRTLPFGFDYSDLKIISDAISTAPFISERKGADLLKKIDGLCCKSKKAELKRTVYSPVKIKSMHSSPSTQIDIVAKAIHNKRKILFDYYVWWPDGKLHKQSPIYPVTPVGFIYDNKCYFLAVYHTEINNFQFYKADKIRDLEITREAAEENDLIDSFDISKYKIFNSQVIEKHEVTATIEFPDEKADAVFDRFGKDFETKQANNNFIITCTVSLDDEFTNWVEINGGKILEYI